MVISARKHNSYDSCSMGVIKSFIIVSVFISVSLSCKVPLVQAFDASDHQKTLIIAGVTNQTNNSEWDDFLISHELSTLIAEEFYDTGYFVPIENNPEIEDKLYSLTELVWKTENISKLSQSIGRCYVPYFNQT